MRKLLIGLLLATACKSSTTVIPVTTASPAAGASSARPALDTFLSAIRAGDLQALSNAWGDKNGPIRESKVVSREEMEARELYLIKCFKHDSYKVLGESQGADSERVLQVELTRGTVKRITDFYTTRGPDRWYVRSGNLPAVQDLCTAK
ncbi:MAG: hypothetical protein ABJE47_19500 [bacterium]